MEVERWDVWGEERVQEERYAACARAEIEDAEGMLGARGGREEEGGEVGGYVFCFWSAERKVCQSVLMPARVSMRENGR